MPNNKPEPKLPNPSKLSEDELAAEIEALLEHRDKLDEVPECPLTVCDGGPHAGVPVPHEPKHRKESSPLAMAQRIDHKYTARPHLKYLSDRLVAAVEKPEITRKRQLAISMPPRMGKSSMVSINLPIWLLHLHPEWKIGLVSHSPELASSWGREVRREITEHGSDYGIKIARDSGAASNWQTTEGGGIVSRSMPGQSVTGLGFNVLIIDDPVKDYADAHSKHSRDENWNWWVANALTRMEPPGIVIVVGTRWHEDDLIGRLLSKEYSGDPADWEVISFPALAETNDVLGRVPGEPLISPLLNETPEEAVARWNELKDSVGSYTWAALYQQKPAPSEGAIFNLNWWKYWTTDFDLAHRDPNTIYIDPDTLNNGQWLDSWDMSFKGAATSDFVVGQRWVRVGTKRLLIHQWRERMDFTQTLAKMRQSAVRTNDVVSPYGHFVYTRLVEEAANGIAIINSLKDEIIGIKPIPAKISKEARARIVTPEIETGHVYLPHPAEPGNEWVADYLSEFRDFPNGLHDDQVDSTTQALQEMKGSGRGSITVPGRDTGAVSTSRFSQRRIERNYAQLGRSRALPSISSPRR